MKLQTAILIGAGLYGIYWLGVKINKNEPVFSKKPVETPKTNGNIPTIKVTEVPMAQADGGSVFPGVIRESFNINTGSEAAVRVYQVGQ